MKNLIGLVFIIVGATFVVGGWGAYFTDSKIQREGISTQARVVEKYVLTDAETGNEYMVKYMFSLPNSRTVTGRGSYRKAQWDAIKKGDGLKVRYDRLDPARNFPEGKGVLSLGLVIFCSLMGVLVGFMGILTLKAKITDQNTIVKPLA